MKSIIYILFLIASGCSTYSTQLQTMPEPNQDGGIWVAKTTQFIGFSGTQFYYCKKNETNNKISPTCYDASINYTKKTYDLPSLDKK